MYIFVCPSVFCQEQKKIFSSDLLRVFPGNYPVTGEPKKLNTHTVGRTVIYWLGVWKYSSVYCIYSDMC